MSDYYCTMADGSYEELRISAPLGIEAAERYALIVWQHIGKCPLIDVEMVVNVRKPDSKFNGKDFVPFKIKAETKTHLVGRETY